MVLKLTVTTYAAEITFKVGTWTRLTFVWPHSRMLFMCMLTSAARSPLIDIEALTPWQPPLTQLFGSPGDKLELLTITLLTIRFLQGLFMTFEQMAAETFTL